MTRARSYGEACTRGKKRVHPFLMEQNSTQENRAPLVHNSTQNRAPMSVEAARDASVYYLLNTVRAIHSLT